METVESKKSRFWNLKGLKNSDFSAMLDPINIEIKGNREVIIEGAKSIAEYDENMVKVNMKKMAVVLFGRGLEIKCLTSDSLVVKGFVTSLEFET